MHRGRDGAVKLTKKSKTETSCSIRWMVQTDPLPFQVGTQWSGYFSTPNFSRAWRIFRQISVDNQNLGWHDELQLQRLPWLVLKDFEGFFWTLLKITC